MCSTFEMVDEAVYAAKAGDIQTTKLWLEAARDIVSFLRIRELVQRFLKGLSEIEAMTARLAIYSIDSALIERA